MTETVVLGLLVSSWIMIAREKITHTEFRKTATNYLLEMPEVCLTLLYIL